MNTSLHARFKSHSIEFPDIPEREIQIKEKLHKERKSIVWDIQQHAPLKASLTSDADAKRLWEESEKLLGITSQI